MVELEDSTASLGDCLLAAALEDALLLGGGAVGLCFSSKPTTTCLEAGCIIQYHHNNQTSLKQECTRDVQDNSMYTPVYILLSVHAAILPNSNDKIKTLLYSISI